MTVKASQQYLKDIVDSIFEVISKNNLLPPTRISGFRSAFHSYLVENNLKPYTNNKELFFEDIEMIVSAWDNPNITFSFLLSEFKNQFKPVSQKTWLKLISEYQVLVFISLLLSLGSLIIQVIKN